MASEYQLNPSSGARDLGSTIAAIQRRSCHRPCDLQPRYIDSSTFELVGLIGVFHFSAGDWRTRSPALLPKEDVKPIPIVQFPDSIV